MVEVAPPNPPFGAPLILTTEWALFGDRLFAGFDTALQIPVGLAGMGIHKVNCRYELEAPFELLVLPAIYLIAGSGGNNFGATG